MQLNDTAIRTRPLLYGTAWKEAETTRLTKLAIEQGFRGIDTANQRKHYDEASVGQGIRQCIAAGLVTREQLFLQTKFTFQAGQDHRLPYDPASPIDTQVKASFASSLEHLTVDYLDSYILHGPSRRSGLAQADRDAWRAMEQLYDGGHTKSIGVSNVSFEQLELLVREARVCPSWVQNRCYAADGWDQDVRRFCRDHGITYQGFSLLTANSKIFAQPELRAIAARHGRGLAQIVFRFAIDVGMLPLTGTTSADHMRGDLEAFDFQLEKTEVATIENIGIRS